MSLADAIRKHFRPLHDQVIVEVPHPKEKILASGLVIPAPKKVEEKNIPDAVEGVVVAVGRGRMVGKHFVETRAKVGQRVLFPQHTGETVRQEFDGGSKSDFFKIYDDEVLCVVEGLGEITGTVSNEVMS